jgi:hypothetical protein
MVYQKKKDKMMSSTDEMFLVEDQEKRKKIHSIYSILNKEKVLYYHLMIIYNKIMLFRLTWKGLERHVYQNMD